MLCDLSSPDATCPRCGFVSKVRGAIRACRRPLPRTYGPGYYLRRGLSWFGIRDDGTCGCDEHAAQMDRWGPDGCEKHMNKILGWLREAAAKRGLPFVEAAGRLAVNAAIAAARRDAAPAAPPGSGG
jgi:hypothetical protein